MPHKMVPAKNKKPIAKWSMYPALHDEVSTLLVEENLHFKFHEDDNDARRIRDHDTNIMGRFVCHNPGCKSKGWSSKMIAVTIRLYPGQEYNARVYHQHCKTCSWVSRPVLDQSYAERIVYRIKKWNGVPVETISNSGSSRGPHNRKLCEGCKAGHCSQSRENAGVDFIAQLERFVSLKSTNTIWYSYWHMLRLTL